MKLTLSTALATFAALVVNAAYADVSTVIVPSSAGGGLDTVARVVTTALQTKTSETYVVDNRGGANGLIGAKAAANAAPDGKTWLLTDSAVLTVNPVLFPKDPKFDPERDLTLVAPIGYQTSVLVVNPKVHPGGLKEFIAAAKQHEIVYASGGIGSAGHLTMAAFGHAAGLKLNHVPYKGGGPAMADLIGGQVGAGFVALSVALPHIRSGALIPLAVASRKRASQLPQVPTVAESGYPGFNVETAFFAFLPSKASSAAAGQLKSRLNQVLADPIVADQIRNAGMEPAGAADASAVQAWVAAEKVKWNGLIQQKVITPQ